MKTEPKLLSDYLCKCISEKQEVIRHMDTKADIALVFIGVVLSIFFTEFVKKGEFSIFHVYLILIPFLISGFFAFLAIYPRARSSSKDNSLLDFSSAAISDTKRWLNKVEKGANREIIEDYLKSNRDLSHIIKSKLKYVRFSYIFLSIGIFIKVIIELFIWIGLSRVF